MIRDRVIPALSVLILPILISVTAYISDDSNPENIKERIAKESSANIVYIDEGKIFEYDNRYYIETSNGRTFRIEGYKE